MMEMRIEELQRILLNNPINADIIEEEQTKVRTIEHHKKLIEYIDNYHKRQFNTIAISMGKPKNTINICDRIFRVFNDKIHYEPSEVNKAYSNIQELNKALYLLHCNFYLINFARLGHFLGKYVC